MHKDWKCSASQQWRARVFEYIQDFDFGLGILNNVKLCPLIQNIFTSIKKPTKDGKIPGFKVIF